jgi:hypothetical protein
MSFRRARNAQAVVLSDAGVTEVRFLVARCGAALARSVASPRQ